MKALLSETMKRPLILPIEEFCHLSPMSNLYLSNERNKKYRIFKTIKTLAKIYTEFKNKPKYKVYSSFILF